MWNCLSFFEVPQDPVIASEIFNEISSTTNTEVQPSEKETSSSSPTDGLLLFLFATLVFDGVLIIVECLK